MPVISCTNHQIHGRSRSRDESLVDRSIDRRPICCPYPSCGSSTGAPCSQARNSTVRHLGHRALEASMKQAQGSPWNQSISHRDRERSHGNGFFLSCSFFSVKAEHLRPEACHEEQRQGSLPATLTVLSRVSSDAALVLELLVGAGTV